MIKKPLPLSTYLFSTWLGASCTPEPIQSQHPQQAKRESIELPTYQEQIKRIRSKLASELLNCIIYAPREHGQFSSLLYINHVQLNPNEEKRWKTIEREYYTDKIPKCGRAKVKAALTLDDSEIVLDQQSHLSISCSKGRITHFLDKGPDGQPNFAGSLDNLDSIYYQDGNNELHPEQGEVIQRTYWKYLNSGLSNCKLDTGENDHTQYIVLQ